MRYSASGKKEEGYILRVKAAALAGASAPSTLEVSKAFTQTDPRLKEVPRLFFLRQGQAADLPAKGMPGCS